MTKQDLLNKLEELAYETNNENIQHELADVFNHIREYSEDFEEAKNYILGNMQNFSNDIRPILFKVLRS